MNRLINSFIEIIEKYNEEKKAEGLIPTVDMLVADLRGHEGYKNEALNN